MQHKPLSLTQVLVCGAAIVTLSMGIRHGFGLWMQPMTQTMGWGREDFAMAIAVQNISWGLIGVFSGMLADRFGAFRVIIVGALAYALGLFGMAHAATPQWLIVTAGVMVGAAQAGTTFAVVFGVIGRNIPPERRSWAMGVVSAAGSFGQFLMVPTESMLITQWGWQQALVMLSVGVLIILPLSLGLREPSFAAGQAPARNQSVVQALRANPVDVPVIVRLAGTNVEEGQKILAESGLPIIRAGSLIEAAERSVTAWKNDRLQNTKLGAQA